MSITSEEVQSFLSDWYDLAITGKLRNSSLVDTFIDAAKQQENRAFDDVARKLAVTLAEGDLISRAFMRQPEIFDDRLVQLMQTAEKYWCFPFAIQVYLGRETEYERQWMAGAYKDQIPSAD